MKRVTHKISEYIERNEKKKNVWFRFHNGKLMFNHSGKWFDAKEFERIYPEYNYIKFNSKGAAIGSKI